MRVFPLIQHPAFPVAAESSISSLWPSRRSTTPRSIPAVKDALLEADVAQVAQLADPAKAFELLLLRPLAGCRTPVVRRSSFGCTHPLPQSTACARTPSAVTRMGQQRPCVP